MSGRIENGIPANSSVVGKELEGAFPLKGISDTVKDKIGEEWRPKGRRRSTKNLFCQCMGRKY